MNPFEELAVNTIMLLWVIGLLILFIYPVLVFYAVWRLLRDVRSIRRAIEHAAYDQTRLPTEARAPEVTRIGLSAFGR